MKKPIDPDTRIVMAWQRRCAIEAAFDGLNERDEEGSSRFGEVLSECDEIIAETPCSSAAGVAAKLHLMKWLKDNGSSAVWEMELLTTAIAALEQVAPDVKDALGKLRTQSERAAA